jgi:hypothetical protein
MDAHKEGDALKRELGLSRRQLLKRGAVVGGTLMWAAPTIQSLASPAFAQMGASPGRHGCCYCYNGDINNPGPNNPATGAPDECNPDGLSDERENRDACQNHCRDEGYENFQYRSGANFCTCSTGSDPNPQNGCDCA